MLEFLHNHTNVVTQLDYNHPHFSGINPYALGFNMFVDIRRICEHPTEEDKQWFPDIAGSNWLDTLHFAMENFKDESFISQFLSPKLIRDFKLFHMRDDDQKGYVEVVNIHDEKGYQKIRMALSNQYNLSNLETNIQVVDANITGDRSLTLEYIPHQNIPLDDSCQEVLKHLYYLWKFDIKLIEKDAKGQETIIAQCPLKEQEKKI